MTRDAAFTRRSFLTRGLALVSAASTVPAFIQRSALGLGLPLETLLTTSVPGLRQDRILVVVQLGGGNDGLNTVIPFGHDEYHRRRPNIRIDGRQALRIAEADGLGLHPNLGGLKSLHDDGLLCTIQGVGYPNPNRSHFTSMDIWQSGDPRNPNAQGWIGRYFDNACRGTPFPDPAINIGREAPKALTGTLHAPISFESEELFRWIGEDVHPALEPTYRDLAKQPGGSGTAPTRGRDETQLEFLTRTTLDAQVASDRIRAAVREQPLVNYPGNPLAQQLRMVAAMIRAGLPTQVYYVNLGGFDTHAGQPGQHANLMNAVGSSLRAFQSELQRLGVEDHVLTMTFSEFGRRVGENASRGTDHGTAAPMFLIGSNVKPGFANPHPSLTDLDGGDLKYDIDFRRIYAAILEDWFRTDSEAVLGGNFRKAPVLKV